MFPGTCLLVAFAALLSADASITPTEGRGACSKFMMEIPHAEHGRSNNSLNEIRYQFKANEEELLHNLKNTCKALGSEVARQIVVACNKNPKHKARPKLAALGTEVLSPVYATCEGVPDCGPIVISVRQVCNSEILKH